MDCPALIAAGLMPAGSRTEMPPSWIKNPVKVEIGSAVTSIGEYVFDARYTLKSVTIPDSVTSIGNNTFYECSNLTTVTIIANGGNAANVKQMMINAGVAEGIRWNMPS